MTTKGLNDAALDRIAKEKGLQSEAGLVRSAADAQIADVHKLAQTLNIEGTPTFIIGDTVIPGEDMEGVQAAIDKARGGSKAG